jgi:uroporphyrinogen III methyltransferase/synthase
MAVGRRDSTPVAMTSLGTTTEQETVVSTLNRLYADTKGMESPAMIIVGDVVGWRDRLSWFETKALFGWRVLVPRTKEQSVGLSDQLRSYGAVPEEVPTISVEPPRTPQQMDRAIKGLVTGRYEWVVFTSTNAVRAVREKFVEYGLDARAYAGLKVAAVGEQTAAALVEFGVNPDLVPIENQSSEGLLEVWPPYDEDLDPINRVLLPRADIATDALIAGLTELGWECDDVTAYRTVRAAPPPEEIRVAIKGGGFDAVLFTSSSTVRNLIGIAGKPHNVTVIAVIGPQTAKTAEEYGLRVDVMADKPSVSALAEALAEYGAKRREAQVAAGEALRKPSQMRRGAKKRR